MWIDLRKALDPEWIPQQRGDILVGIRFPEAGQENRPELYDTTMWRKHIFEKQRTGEWSTAMAHLTKCIVWFARPILKVRMYNDAGTGEVHQTSVFANASNTERERNG